MYQRFSARPSVLGLVLLLMLGGPDRVSAAAAPTPAAPPSLNSHPARSRERVCLSLRVLQEELRKSPLRPEAINLGGIGWLEGYVLDPLAGDIILVGRRAPGWPELHLDDLLVNLRNVSYGEPPPFCSLDPVRENVLKSEQFLRQGIPSRTAELRAFVTKLGEVLGPQQTIVGGVPRNSRHARIMIEADYRMKKLSQGLERVAGVSSCLDLALASYQKTLEQTGKLPAMGLSHSRFWFQIGKGEPTYLESAGSVLLDRCNVGILTERQRATASGALVDAGGDDPNARTFAAQLSERFDEASLTMREFAELTNLFRLSALLRTMQFQSALRQARIDFGYVLSTYAFRAESPLPASLPALTNSRELRGKSKQMTYYLAPVICGGVSMQMVPVPERAPEKRSAVTAWSRLALQHRPDAAALVWFLPEF